MKTRFAIAGVVFYGAAATPTWAATFNDKNIQSALRFRAWVFLLSAAAILTLLLSTANSSFAGSATWLASPGTEDWNTAGNWTAGGPFFTETRALR
jgi:hypothetical protein